MNLLLPFILEADAKVQTFLLPPNFSGLFFEIIYKHFI